MTPAIDESSPQLRPCARMRRRRNLLLCCSGLCLTLPIVELIAMLKIVLAFACLAGVVATDAAAQEFPAKPVSLMMPYAAGGPGDAITRIVGQGMSKVLGKQFLVENVAGAGGTIGTAKVAAAAPDGYSLLVMHLGHAANTALYPNLRYDAVANFEPIGMIAESPMAFVARKDFPADNFNDFVAYVKTNREKVVHGHAGVGSASHLCGLLFLNAIEVPVTVVPYKGADLNLASILVWGKMGRLDLSADLDVARWLDSCFVRPAYRRVRDRTTRK